MDPEEGKVNHLSAVYRLQKKGVVQHLIFLPGLSLWEQLLEIFNSGHGFCERNLKAHTEKKEQRAACGAVYRL